MNLIQNIGKKLLYGFGFGLGMGLSFKIMPIEKQNFKRRHARHARTTLLNKDEFTKYELTSPSRSKDKI